MLKNNIQKNYLGQQAGFTLTELLVVMFIISLLSGLVLANHRSGQKRYALSQATQQLVSDLRKAQNMAMSGVDIEGQYYGYGIYIRRLDSVVYYRIYADKDDDNKYDSGESLETVNLPEGIEIKATSPASKVDVFFRSPEPTTYINYPASVNPGTITLELKGTSSTKTITVTTTGLIYSN